MPDHQATNLKYSTILFCFAYHNFHLGLIWKAWTILNPEQHQMQYGIEAKSREALIPVLFSLHDYLSP